MYFSKELGPYGSPTSLRKWSEKGLPGAPVPGALPAPTIEAPDQHQVDFPVAGCVEQFLAGFSPDGAGVHFANLRAIVQPRRAAYSHIARFCMASVCWSFVDTQMRSTLSFLVIEYYGGAAGRIPNDATAYPHRSFPWDFIFGAQWADPLEASTHRDWARRGEDVLRPYSANAHLSSALDVEAEEVIQTAFGANLPRLRVIKEKYDPANFFRVNYNIRPASAQAGAA